MRQAVIGAFIVDFLAAEVWVVVEVDGGCHARKRRADELRDAKLRRWGYRVVRVEVAEVESDIAAVLRRVREALAVGM